MSEPSPVIADTGTLRDLYGEPGETAARKIRDRLDAHCRRFIALSPFLQPITYIEDHYLIPIE